MIVLRQIYAVFLALDLLLSALTGGGPLQTLSARFAKYRAKNCKIAVILADATDYAALKVFGQHNHCDSALSAYEARERVASAWEG